MYEALFQVQQNSSYLHWKKFWNKDKLIFYKTGVIYDLRGQAHIVIN